MEEGAILRIIIESTFLFIRKKSSDFATYKIGSFKFAVKQASYINFYVTFKVIRMPSKRINVLH
jgi:hypothetical protein